jgi:ABC-type sugar transport system ATPase subunit
LWGKWFGVDVTWFDGGLNIDVQHKAIEDMATGSWDFVAIQTLGIDTLVDPISRITAKRIPVVQMLGEDANALRGIHASEEPSTHTPQEVVLTVADFTLQDEFEHVSFVLHRREVFGLFGFMGAGQVQVGRCLFAARRADSGTARLEGTRLNLSNTTTATASDMPTFRRTATRA